MRAVSMPASEEENSGANVVLRRSSVGEWTGASGGSGIASFAIELDDSGASVFFEPAQCISGRTVLVLTQAVAVSQITVQVQGLVSGGLSHALLQNRIAKQPPPLACTRHLFKDVITLFPSASMSAETKLLPGKHTWPFSFRVPPVSILPPTYRGKMGAVKYEAVATLRRSVLAAAVDAKPPKLVVRREFPVRNVESRAARRARETPLFKQVEVGVGGALWLRRGKIDLAVRMPRNAFSFEEPVQLTIDIINHSIDGMRLSDIAIEERVAVVYTDGSTWGPLTTTRIPFPYEETIPPSARSTVRSFHLSLPPLEPQHPHPLPHSTHNDPTIPAYQLISRRCTSSTSILSNPPLLRTLSRAVPASTRSATLTATPSLSSTTTQQQGLNATFTTQPLKLTHHLTLRLRSLRAGSPTVTMEIPLHLVPRAREAYLLFRDETLLAVVEEVEREEEERVRRRGGGGREREDGTGGSGRGSLEALPLYERGGLVGLEEVVEATEEDAGRWWRGRGSTTVVGSDGSEQIEEHAGLPPGYDAYGFDDMDSCEVEEVQILERASSSTSSVDDIGDQVAPMPSVPFSAFLGEEVISLSPFVDNNPPSFQSLVQDGDSGASEERWLGARRSNLSMRSLWGGSSVAGTRMAHSVAPVKGIEDEIGANYERGVAAFGAALLEDVLFTGSPQIGGERAHGVRGLSSGISVGGSPPRGSPVASGRGSLFGASPRRSLLALESSGLGTTAMGSPGSLRGTALSGSSGCGPGSVTGSPRSGSSQATGPRIMSDAFASASPSASTSFTFTEGNASMRHRHEISGTQSPVVSLLSEAHAAETATVRNQQSRFFASVRAASSRASLRDLFHRRGGDLAHAETAQGGREEMEIGEAVGQQQRGLGKWRAGRSRGRMFNGLVDGLLGKFKKERSNVGLESGSGVGVMGTRAVA